MNGGVQIVAFPAFVKCGTRHRTLKKCHVTIDQKSKQLEDQVKSNNKWNDYLLEFKMRHASNTANIAYFHYSIEMLWWTVNEYQFNGNIKLSQDSGIWLKLIWLWIRAAKWPTPKFFPCMKSATCRQIEQTARISHVLWNVAQN